jgi:hypothetical protein
MAHFIGTIKDYEKYIGPRIKNVVNSIAKQERDKRHGICEFCGKKAELQSAHKHGKERLTIIHSVLEQYNNGNYLDIDIEKCENNIVELHKPINEAFYFLCAPCHRKYDSGKEKSSDTGLKEEGELIDMAPEPTQMDFKSWMEGKGLSKRTVNAYYVAITGVITEWAIEYNITHRHIININDSIEFGNIKMKIYSLPIFQERNTLGHNMYSCALDKYEEYLCSKK